MKEELSMVKAQRSLLRGAVGVFLTVALVSSGCSVNPATGGRQLILIGEEQEIAMGREAHEGIVATMGVYPDDAAQQYVDRLGKELAALSERPSLPWTFTVIGAAFSLISTARRSWSRFLGTRSGTSPPSTASVA
jgi:predicted Zn-dependent protease